MFATEKDITNILFLLRVALKKYAGAFALGEGMSAVRVFAHVFALTAASEMRCVVVFVVVFARDDRCRECDESTDRMYCCVFRVIALDFTN